MLEPIEGMMSDRDWIESLLSSWVEIAKSAKAQRDPEGFGVRTGAMIHLFTTDEENALTTLLDIAQSGDEKPRAAACLFLGFLAKEGVSAPRTIKILYHIVQSNSSDHVMLAALYGLFAYNDPDAIEFVRESCQEEGIEPDALIAMILSGLVERDL